MWLICLAVLYLYHPGCIALRLIWKAGVSPGIHCLQKRTYMTKMKVSWLLNYRSHVGRCKTGSHLLWHCVIFSTERHGQTKCPLTFYLQKRRGWIEASHYLIPSTVSVVPQFGWSSEIVARFCKNCRWQCRDFALISPFSREKSWLYRGVGIYIYSKFGESG